ncbi:MAG TPA: transporter substrate-binding domain-containing protein [Desulfobulbus sp.]|nr:transporter substrate-binding domain-containing protein [Desulfobulbus sp.]
MDVGMVRIVRRIKSHRSAWWLLALLFTAFIGLVSLQGSSRALEGEIRLTAEEQAWLAEHPVVRLAPDPDFPPVEFFDSTGRYRGIAADLVALVEKKLPIRFEIVHLKNWDEVLRQGRNRQIDMFGAAVPTPERLQYMKFTRPFVTFPAVILVRDNMKIPPRKVTTLEGLHVAVVSGYAAYEYMKRAYPRVKLEVMPDISSGLRQVSFGKVDAMVLNLASASYYIRKDGITNLSIYKDTDFMYDLSFATRSDWPLLCSILDKAVASITPEEHNRITGSWITLRKGRWFPSRQVLLAMGIAALVLLLIGILAWNISLKRQVSERTAELKNELLERIRAEKEKEALQRVIHRSKKMEALGLLAGGVAHDLNNILSGIVGYPDLMLSRLEPDDPMYGQLEAIKRSGLQAVAVVADLLTIARGSASEKKPLDINGLVRDYLASPEYKQLADRYPRVTLVLDLCPDLPALHGSPVHIRKSIMNLVINGYEAIKDRPGEVRIRTARQVVTGREGEDHDGPKPGEYVVLTVADTGIGIAAEDLDRVFEPFYSKKHMARSGSGLGLAVVWNTVQDHEGHILVHSDEGGTRFELYFQATDAEGADEDGEGTESVPRGRGERILVVDDEEPVRELARTILTHLGYRPETVASGEEAVNYLKYHEVELVILDMIMEPGMDGLETYRRILEVAPGQRAIIASGYAEDYRVRAAMELGAGLFIRKPYTIRQLAHAVQAELA